MKQALIALALLVCSLLPSARGWSQDWDFAGVQNTVGVSVFSGLGEPLDLRVVPIKEGVLQTAVAMRIEVGTELIRIHIDREIDPLDDVVLPDCASQARVIVMTGHDFESEFIEVDTVIIDLRPSPVKLLLSDARIDTVRGQPLLLISGIKQVRSRGEQGSVQTDVEVVEAALTDATGARLTARSEGPLQRSTAAGRVWEYTMSVHLYRSDGRPPLGRIKGTVEIAMTGSRIVCGQRSAPRTMRKILELR